MLRMPKIQVKTVPVILKCKLCGVVTPSSHELAKHERETCPFRSRITSQERYERMRKNKDAKDAKRMGVPTAPPNAGPSAPPNSPAVAPSDSPAVAPSDSPAAAPQDAPAAAPRSFN
ncbi:hypothetical protein R6Q59_024604 [Mikania micrantha]